MPILRSLTESPQVSPNLAASSQMSSIWSNILTCCPLPHNLLNRGEVLLFRFATCLNLRIFPTLSTESIFSFNCVIFFLNFLMYSAHYSSSLSLSVSILAILCSGLLVSIFLLFLILAYSSFRFGILQFLLFCNFVFCLSNLVSHLRYE